jgi:hypothetical protein
MREVTGSLGVWDAAACRQTSLAVGSILHGCTVRRNRSLTDANPEVYVVEFVCDGRSYTCALSAFQPRTRWAVAASVDDELFLPAAAS